MNTIIRNIDADPACIEAAGEILKQGGLVAFPTETVYGLGANALDSEAAAKIYAAKGRPSDNPLIVHIADMEALPLVAEQIPETARKLAEAFWPGPLSMIFRKTEQVPYGTTGGLDTVAVRMPADETALKVIRAGGGYIAAPSANTSGKPSPTRASHVIEDLDGRVDMILDGGEVPIGLESTIVDMSSAVPMILRPGYITRAMLERVIGPVDVDQGILEKCENEKAPKAPGMKYRHYAPKAPLVLVKGEAQKVAAFVNCSVAEKQSLQQSVGIIASAESAPFYKGGVVKLIGSEGDPEEIAHNLYHILREFDTEEVQVIYSEAFFEEGLGQAIMNRLSKAAGYQVIYV